MAPTKGGVAKQIQNQNRPTAATPVYNHDGTNIVITPSSGSNSRHYSHLNIPFSNVPPGISPGISRNDGLDSPFTQFTQQQQQQSFNNVGMNPLAFNHQHHQHQQGHFNGSDPLSASSSAPTPTPTPGPAPMNSHGFQGGYYNNNMRQMVNPNNFYPNGAGAHTGSLGPMFGNNMQGMQSPEPFGSQSMQQQQGQYGMPMNYNMGFGFQQQQHQNQSSFNMNGNMMYMLPVSPSSNTDFNSNYEPPSTASSDTPPDRDFSVNDDGMDLELEVDTVDMLSGGSYGLLSPSTEMLTSPSSTENGNGAGLDTVVKGEDFGTSSSALSPPLIGEAKSVNGTPTLSTLSKTSSISSNSNGTAANSKSSLPSSKEKEQNKQKLYRNRKSEFTNKMRDELLGMGMLPSTRVTHAPEIMSKTADTLRDYRELLEIIQNKIEGMPSNISAVPGAVKKLLNENGNLFNNLRQAPQQQQQQTQQQQQPTHTFKPDIKVPLGTNMTGTTTNPLTGRVTRSGAHVF